MWDKEFGLICKIFIGPFMALFIYCAWKMTNKNWEELQERKKAKEERDRQNIY